MLQAGLRLSKIHWTWVLLFVVFVVMLSCRAIAVVKKHLPDRDGASLNLAGNIVVTYMQYGFLLILVSGIAAVERNTLELRLALSADRKRLLAQTYGKSTLIMTVLALSHGLVWWVSQQNWRLPPVHLVTLYDLKPPSFAAQFTQMFTGGLVVSTLSVCVTLLVRSRPVLVTVLVLLFPYVVIMGWIPFLRISIMFPRRLSQIVAHLVPVVLHVNASGGRPCIIGSWPVYQVVYCAVVFLTTVARFDRADL